MDCACAYAENDGEYLVLLSKTEPKARKQYNCNECCKPILPGDKYRREVGVFEEEGGGLETYHTCMICAEIRDTFFSCGFTYGGLIEDFQNHIEASDGQIKGELIKSLSPPTKEKVLSMIAKYVDLDSDDYED